MSLAVKQSAAEKLVPMVYPWLLRGTPERSPQSMSCGYFPYMSSTMRQRNVWRNEPGDTCLMEPHDYFLSDGRSIPAPYWFAKAGVAENNLTPPESLGTLLFAPANSETGTLGMNVRSFLSPRGFGSIRQANDAAYKCDLS